MSSVINSAVTTQILISAATVGFPSTTGLGPWHTTNTVQEFINGGSFVNTPTTPALPGYQIPKSGVYFVSGGFGFLPTQAGLFTAAAVSSGTGTASTFDLVLAVYSGGTTSLLERAAMGVFQSTNVLYLLNRATLQVSGSFALLQNDIIYLYISNSTGLPFTIPVQSATDELHHWFSAVYQGPYV